MGDVAAELRMKSQGHRVEAEGSILRMMTLLSRHCPPPPSHTLSRQCTRHIRHDNVLGIYETVNLLSCWIIVCLIILVWWSNNTDPLWPTFVEGEIIADAHNYNLGGRRDLFDTGVET